MGAKRESKGQTNWPSLVMGREQSISVSYMLTWGRLPGNDRKSPFKFRHRELKPAPATLYQSAFENLQQRSEKANWLRTSFFAGQYPITGYYVNVKTGCRQRWTLPRTRRTRKACPTPITKMNEFKAGAFRLTPSSLSAK